MAYTGQLHVVTVGELCNYNYCFIIFYIYDVDVEQGWAMYGMGNIWIWTSQDNLDDGYFYDGKKWHINKFLQILQQAKGLTIIMVSRVPA